MAKGKVNFNDADLKKIGWSGRKPKSPMKPPGACSALKATTKDETGTIYLEWDKPVKGGRPAFYRIERLVPPGPGWHLEAAVHHNSAAVTDQPKSKPLKFRVMASNKAGEGDASNTVTITA